MLSNPLVVNTAEEAIAIRRLLEASDRSIISSRILLVTSAFHMCSAQRLFERQGMFVEPFPVDFQASGEFFLTFDQMRFENSFY